MIEIDLLNEKKRKLNFLQSKDLNFNIKNLLFNAPKHLWVAVGILFAELLAVVVISIMLGNTVGRLESKKAKLSNMETRVRKYKANIVKVKRLVKIVQKLEKGRNEPVIILEDVANTIPDGLWLTDLKKNGNILTISGKSFTTEAVAEYMSKLGSLKEVKAVKFARSGLRKVLEGKNNSIYAFSFIVELR